MTTFVQNGSDIHTFNKCLEAINKIASTELWIDMFNEEATKGKFFPRLPIILHNWKDIENTDVDWIYTKTFAQEAAYEYADYNGKHLRIIDDNGYSKVVESLGIPDNIVDKLQNLSFVYLSENLDLFFNGKVTEDTYELKIADYVG